MLQVLSANFVSVATLVTPAVWSLEHLLDAQTVFALVTLTQMIPTAVTE